MIGLFSNEELSGIGFGLGDVTLQNFLKSHNLHNYYVIEGGFPALVGGGAETEISVFK